MLRQFGILVFAAAFLTGCPSQPVKMDGVTTVKKAGVLSVTATWVKDKDKKFDAGLKITNESADNTLLIFVGDMTCERGGIKGELSIEGNPRILDIRPGEVRNLILKCNLQNLTKGDFVVTMKKIFENPKQDSTTPGKVVAENFTWKQGASEGKIQ